MDEQTVYSRDERAYVHLLGLMCAAKARPARHGFALGVEIGVWLQGAARKQGTLARRVMARFGVSRSQAYRWITAWRDESAGCSGDPGLSVCSGLRFARAVSAGRACTTTIEDVATHWQVTRETAQRWVSLYQQIASEACE